ncbi:LppU/SCO3897 family protein [Streptomyces spectabilis]|uniref:Uncharacterized protein n=1 Tax=Streptomyces spectabilis TaxID=68270 RepID=A0A5P2XEM6_STRST|nr:hypothetical protein [Streptomyces spectabilis]MBB5103961.1 hypothetical protein [Streptomyces spectabilis]MCI3903804.1 hypothetical protein [Streptomyces spectabilis]QEV60976.1 hypothetical protein CP982_21535 [Streptomyces spectabilis]GGV40520.1 hypothetical protein GCM10010245_64110 [Streptomyces spectabilis]
MSTPPPQGQNPFGQGQQPYGQPQGPGAPHPQGAAPYGQTPPPYPQHPGGAPQQGVPFYQGGPDPVAPRKGKKKFIFIGVAVAVVIGLAVTAVMAGKDEPSAAKVGDCMSIGNPANSTDPDLKIVDCGDKKAKYKVMEKKESGACDRNKYAEYRETGGSDDFTLCLKPYVPSGSTDK